MPTNAELAAQVAELTDQVATLTRRAERAREAQSALARGGQDSMSGNAEANAREAAVHQAWKDRMGYSAKPVAQISLEANDEYQQQVAAALKAEAAQKEFLQNRARESAARRAASGTPEPDAMQRAASSAQRQRDIERERKTRLAPIIVAADGPATDLR